jgi:hypothetical protein
VERLDLLALGGARLARQDDQHVQFGPEPLRRPPCAAHDPLRRRLRRHQREQPLADRLLDQLPFAQRHVELQPLGLDILGDLAERDLAQRFQVLDAEEAVERRRHACGRVDLPGLQSLDQRLRGEVDEHDLVRLGEDGVGERLAHARAGQRCHLVVERLEMLDVDGRVDVDPGGEDVGNVLVALGVLEPGRVGVRELVDQAQLRSAVEDAREVHLYEIQIAIRRVARGDARQPVRLRLGLRTAVRLQVADHDVTSGLELRPPVLEHAIRLADARGHAQEDLVMTDHAPRRLWTTRSISLIPMNGVTRPPRP